MSASATRSSSPRFLTRSESPSSQTWSTRSKMSFLMMTKPTRIITAGARKNGPGGERPEIGIPSNGRTTNTAQNPNHMSGKTRLWKNVQLEEMRFIARRPEAGALLRRRPRAVAVAALDVVDDDLLEVGGDGGPAQRGGLLAVDEDRRGRLLAGAGERDADVGVLGFAGAVDDAAHYRDVEPLDARIARLPFRHGVADEVLDAGGELLESGRGGAAAARTGGDQRHEGAQPHGLEEFLRHLDFESAVAVRLRRERNADGVADALLQENAHGGRRGDHALASHAGFGQPEVERVIAAPRHFGVDADQILHGRHFGRENDAVLRQADVLGALRRQQRRLDHG